MYCQYCGSILSAGDKYCSNCGEPPLPPISVQPISNNNQLAIQQQPPANSQSAECDSAQPTAVALAFSSFFISLSSLFLCWLPIMDVGLTATAVCLTSIAMTKIKQMKQYSWMPWAAWGINIASALINLFTIL